MQKNIFKQSLFIIFLMFVATVLSSCILKKQTFIHSPQLAAKPAMIFAQIVFINKDFKQGYKLMPNLKESTTLENFQKIIASMHPRSFPTEFHSPEYEPMLGQRGMNIFLEGYNRETQEKFYYRLVMEGTSDTQYKVNGIFRGNGPYPQSSLRKPVEFE